MRSRHAAERWRSPIRVALTATGTVAVAYLIVAILVTSLVGHGDTERMDARLAAALTRVTQESMADGESPELQADDASFGPYLLAWVIDARGVVQASNSSLALPASYQHLAEPQTITLDGRELRVRGGAAGNSWVVVGQSASELAQTGAGLMLAEVVIGVLLLLAVFAGAVIIGRRVAGPLERAQQRQRDFTADASHELRTPLAVIEAQAALALSAPRDVSWHEQAFAQVAVEGKRMRHLVEDLLWLARLDATNEAPGAEPVDLITLATRAVERFEVLAAQRNQHLELHTEELAAIVIAPPEWLDRLLGVLLDNACKYTPDGGLVRVSVTQAHGRVSLEVADSGPGIPEAKRAQILKRFYRASGEANGAGLGLAIGDAIVRATEGRWRIGVSELGGASLSVSWARTTL